MQLGDDPSKRSGANVFNSVGVGGVRTPGETCVASGYNTLRRRLTRDFNSYFSTAYQRGEIIKRVCVEKTHVSRGNKTIVNSHVFVLEDSPVARLLLNWYSRLLGLGQ